MHKILSSNFALDDIYLRKYRRFYDSPSQYGIPQKSYQALADDLLKRVKEALGEENSFEHQDLDCCNFFTIRTIVVVTDPRTPDDKCPGSVDSFDSASMDEALLMSHASSAMAVSSRHFVTGVHVDRSKVTLWYFDRSRIIRTAVFDFLVAPTKLALVVYALNHPRCRYGFDPFLIPRKSISCGSPAMKELIGSDIILPIDDDTEVRFRIVGPLIHGSRRILGRGTTVYAVAEISQDGTWRNDLVMKMSWPNTSRVGEATFLAALSGSLPTWMAHIPQVIYDDTYTAGELDLPRVNVPLDFEDRHLSVLVTPRYQPLWEVDNIKEFETAFIHCVALILNDWNLAGIVNPWGTIDADGSVTGTLPFMAIELLDENHPPHHYEHDLESFFYVLVWAAVHFDIQFKVRLPTHRIAFQWLQTPWDAKWTFLFDDEHMQLWSSEVLEDFQDLWRDWVLPLRELFTSARLPGGKAVTFEAFLNILRREPFRHVASE
ncbi:hypothetical protein DXG03_003546 [Asterophora parasitica]|uniref:Fungal-type protein kinase domain-containing protein n=1 Tax=Asterophora parasitica TaxID=117018 RepID=A0A9P7G800_9AGAR|nr:hypothetical protein DXG03_003546 [Asterophora parasitica]